MIMIFDIDYSFVNSSLGILPISSMVGRVNIIIESDSPFLGIRLIEVIFIAQNIVRESISSINRGIEFFLLEPVALAHQNVSVKFPQREFKCFVLSINAYIQYLIPAVKIPAAPITPRGPKL